MEITDYSRKIDSTGRIIIPPRLRDEMNIKEGQTYTFFKHYENGRAFLCIECPQSKSEFEKALEIVRQHGYEI